METLNTIIEASKFALGPNGPYILFGLVFMFIALIAYWAMAQEKADPLYKLEQTTKDLAWTKTKHHGTKLRENKSNEKLEKYAKLLQPQDMEDLTAIRKKLMMAGYRSVDAVRYYHLAQLGLSIGGLILGLLYYQLMLTSDDQTSTAFAMYCIVPAGLGYWFPIKKVNGLVEKRREAIQDGFPDTLDMMLICVQAGQSLDQTINRVSVEIGPNCPEMGEELMMVAYELKAGKERSLVLKDFADRLQIPDIASFVTVMIQSAAFGSSISEALNVYATEMRDKRVMRAEEKANKLPTKMTLATMMFSVPPLLMILVGPSLMGLGDLGGSGLF